jgi:phage terminase large subunit-like protein
MFLIISKYEGTRLGRQELMGDIFEEAEGALWTRDMVDRARWAALALPVVTAPAHPCGSSTAR